MQDKPKITEDMLQVVTAEWLDPRNGWRLPSIAHHSPNEGKLPIQYRIKQLKRGMLPGYPDWVFHLPGARTVFLELKRAKKGKSPAGRLTDEQKEFQAAAIELGFDYHLLDNTDDIKRLLEEERIIRSESRRAA
jgi:hypothetical protein